MASPRPEPLTEHHLTAIRVRGLTFGYPGLEVLRDLHLEIGFGSVTAVAGPNGSGKSTLVELLAGVRSAQNGVVERCGEVALVVQRPAAPETLPLTVREVVTMGTWGRRRQRRQTVRATVAEMIDAVGLRGLEGRLLGELSGGQRQRTMLAQALARRAPIIIMDEPDTGLDAASRRGIQDLLFEQAHTCDVAVVCATHDDSLIARADRVVRLTGGRVSQRE